MSIIIQTFYFDSFTYIYLVFANVNVLFKHYKIVTYKTFEILQLIYYIFSEIFLNNKLLEY